MNDRISDIFDKTADRCIQNIYRQLRKTPEADGKYPGVLASLLMLDKLSIEDIKASVTELMAGGVDTVCQIIYHQCFHCKLIFGSNSKSCVCVCVCQTSITLLWTLYELARHPDLQEEIRVEISAARVASNGDMVQMLKMVPLLKGALKETLR